MPAPEVLHSLRVDTSYIYRCEYTPSCIYTVVYMHRRVCTPAGIYTVVYRHRLVYAPQCIDSGLS